MWNETREESTSAYYIPDIVAKVIHSYIEWGRAEITLLLKYAGEINPKFEIHYQNYFHRPNITVLILQWNCSWMPNSPNNAAILRDTRMK